MSDQPFKTEYRVAEPNMTAKPLKKGTHDEKSLHRYDTKEQAQYPHAPTTQGRIPPGGEQMKGSKLNMQ
jgi:hypothetical protein